ncbi:hypothetical protein [Thermoflexibacter ruber]|uniref:Uncharacterized protein n=1 Tax=Thermoflexibacter ruber TaxID=1003 RepID=A0A1I2CNC9_9BACT|nr:hypothetical protein [Thermoflexibacter ruber]SFE69632.1 hypothetical protein SAMN04488541_100579 [Thermoflexibacter ruber]
METLVEIPQALIYEVINGKPIYDKNYKKVLHEGATQVKPWLTYGWESTISLFDNYELNLAKLIKQSELF